MKTKISKLAKGIFEENNMELSVSVTSLAGNCVTDGYINDSFVVASMSDEEARGIVCSDNYRIIIENTSFIGKNAAINYMVNAKGMAIGEKIRGTVSIISDGGELLIPCEFDIIEEYVETSIGKVSNLFNFANLVQQNFEEALAIFAGEDFVRIFIHDNPKMQAVYEGLIKGNDIKNALEEFLIYAGKKKRLVFTIKVTSKEYDNITENYADKLVIQKNVWGYERLRVKTSGDFIHVVKNEISTEEFVGNIYELSYLIEPEKLHAGNNYGRITIVTQGRELTYEITVHKRGLQESVDKKKLKESLVELSNNYFEFRMRRMTTDNWAKNSMQLIDTISEIDDSFDFIKLLRAQVLIAQKKHEEAVGFINEVGARLRAGKKKQEFLYCYYLYVRTLYSKNVTVTKDAIEEIEEFYKRGQKDVRIMWILLYLDEEYAINKSLRLARIKEQYVKGARSPFFYYEACAVFNEQPGLLRVLNPFEIQALWWGCRNNMLNLKVAEQLARLVSAERQFNPLLYRIMAHFCEKYDKTALLEVLCRYIVSNITADRKYFRWYEKGVIEGFEFDGLYEAYMDTLQYTEEAVPHNVALYFAYNNDSGHDKKAFLFSNILKHETEYSNIIRNYVPQIKAFAKEQLNAGNISADLAYIYRKVIERADINKNNAANYVNIQLTKKLVCKPGTFAETMSSVIVKHKEYEKEMVCPLVDGVAYFAEYTNNAAILFEDDYGNRYVAPGDYEYKDLLNQVNMLKKSLELAPEKFEYSLYMVERKSRQYNKNVIARYQSILTAADGVKKYYRNYIYRRMIDYFMDNNDSENLDYYLKKADVGSLEPKERTKVIELLLIQGLYDEAYALIKEHGYDNISVNRLMHLCTIYLKEQGITKEDAFFTGLCAYAFNCSKYGEDILLYLLKYYNSNTRNLYRLWSVSKDFGIDTSGIEERLIVQMLFTEAYFYDIMDVFESYYKKNRNDIVAKAYLNSRSYLYFAQNMVIHEKTFEYLERELLNDYGLSDISKMALLKYYSDKEMLTEKELMIAKEFVAELQKAGYTFAFYNKFADKFVLPFELRDKLIIEYKTKKGRYVELKYLFDAEEAADDVAYQTEVMEESFEGNYVRPFVIFYGEKLKYYIAENEGEETKLTESGTREMLSLNMEGEPGKYGLLNEMCSAKALKDEQALNEAMREYERQVRLVEECFLPIMEE